MRRVENMEEAGKQMEDEKEPQRASGQVDEGSFGGFHSSPAVLFNFGGRRCCSIRTQTETTSGHISNNIDVVSLSGPSPPVGRDLSWIYNARGYRKGDRALVAIL